VTQFEEVACKGLGIILIILVVFLSFQLIGCSCPAPQPPSDYMDEVKMKNLA